MEAPQGFEVAPAIAAQPEGAADEDRPVAPRRIELVHGLDEEGRRQPIARRLLAAERDHVRGDVAAVDVEAGAEIGEEQATRSAGHVERGLAVPLDERPEVVDLRPALVELGPPLGHQPVVPGLRFRTHPREA